VGDLTNIETDILARHVARLAAFSSLPAASPVAAANATPRTTS
jgi:riboflavin synthase alpha subunit